MKILFLSNIPAPYRVDFFNELGRNNKVTVIFEAERNYKLNKKWYKDVFTNFNAIFLKKGEIKEKKVNWRIIKEINKFSDHMIIVTNYSYLTEMLGIIYLKIKKIPYILEIDGGLIKEERKVKYKLKNFLISNAKAYLSPSKVSDDFLIHYGANKERLFRYPFTSIKEKDLLPETVKNKEKNNIKKNLNMKESKIVLYVGRFIYGKGIDVLLEAAARFSEDVGLYLVGDDPSDEILDLIKNLNIKNVHFPGFKEKEELKNYYKAADVFVLPTRQDVWGLVINEAMSFGLPVITTDMCGSGLELIEEGVNGHLIPINDSIELAKKINNLFNDDKLLLEMSNNNLRKIKNYTIETMAKRHEEVLSSLVFQKNKNN